MSAARRIIAGMVSIFRFISNAVILPLLLLVILADILMRSLWLAPIPWAQELIGLLILCLFLTGLPVLTAKTEWLAVDFLVRFADTVARKWLEHLSAAAIALLSRCIAFAGFVATRDTLAYQESSLILKIPYWPLTALMCISAGISALAAVFPSRIEP